MSYQNVLLKILLILTMGKSAVALARQTEDMVSRYPANSFEQSGNLKAADKKVIGVTADKEEDDDVNHKEEEMEDEEDSFHLVDKRDTMVGFPNCLGKRQALGNLTRERQLRGGIGVMREGLDEKEEVMEDEEDMEDEDNTFQLVDKRSKTLIQPRQLCQHK